MDQPHTTTPPAGDSPRSSEGLGASHERPKWVIYNRSESLLHSLASDAATFGGMVLCIWFSQHMGSGVWEFVSLVMFTVWALCRMPWERISNTTKLSTKAEALAWAESLPDDGA